MVSKKKRSSPTYEGFFWPKSQIFRPKAGDLQKKKKKGLRRNHKFSDKKQVISKKKKVFAEIRRLFLAEIANFNVFSAQKHQLLPKKIPWGGKKKIGGAKTKIGGAKTKIGGALPPCLPLATRLGGSKVTSKICSRSILCEQIT